MTREEQLDWLCRLRSEIYVYMPKEWLIPMNDALDMSIKTLEQEPIIDNIRAKIKDWQTDIHDNEYDADKYDFVFERIYEIIDECKAESENS